jgi:hypothetical protein
MSTTKKLTKKDYFSTLRTYVESLGDVKIGNLPADDVIAFIDHEVDLLTKKSGGEKKPTAQQTANEGIKTAIAEGMTENRLYTVTEIQKEIPECAELSNQRVSALLRQMIADGVIVRTEDKRKAYFSLA